jgi:hypothetical protein
MQLPSKSTTNRPGKPLQLALLLKDDDCCVPLSRKVIILRGVGCHHTVAHLPCISTVFAVCSLSECRVGWVRGCVSACTWHSIYALTHTFHAGFHVCKKHASKKYVLHRASCLKSAYLPESPDRVPSLSLPPFSPSWAEVPACISVCRCHTGAPRQGPLPRRRLVSLGAGAADRQ